MVKIVHVLTHEQVTRGGAIQAMLLARMQLEQGHDVRVVCNHRPDVPLHSSFARWAGDVLPLHPYRMKGFGEMRRFRRFLREHRPDVIHCHRNTALEFAWLSTLLWPGAPVIVSQRGTTREFQSRFIAFIHRSRRVRRVIAVAEAVKDVLVSERMDPGRVRVVYGSCDLDRFDPDRVRGGSLRADLGIPAGRRIVVQVGELNQKKAPDDFVRAAAAVLKRRDDCDFVLVGEGKLEKRCRRVRAELGVEEHVHLAGYRTDVPEVYASADVATCTSVENEGLTGAVREALAMARPVVATRVSGNPEVVRDGESGLLVPPSDPRATADAIERLLDDRDLAESFGRRGREIVLELMHPNVRRERTEAVYREAIAEAREGGEGGEGGEG